MVLLRKIDDDQRKIKDFDEIIKLLLEILQK